MKLSNETITLLKNYSTINPSVLFKQGNVLATISPQRSIFAKASITEEVPRQFAVAELNKFLGVLSMFKDPELNFSDNHVEICSGSKKVRYTYADVSAIITPPEKELKFPEAEVEFELKADDLNAAVKALSVLSLPELAITGDGENVMIQAISSKNSTADNYSQVVATADKKFRAILKTENLKLLNKDYKVSVAKNIVKFEADDITYFVAVEANSTF
jgi:hypothetical protein